MFLTDLSRFSPERVPQTPVMAVSASLLCRQVLDWTQQMLAAGEAFSGAECTSLRDTIGRQSGKFFDAYHQANLQVRWGRLQ